MRAGGSRFLRSSLKLDSSNLASLASHGGSGSGSVVAGSTSSDLGISVGAGIGISIDRAATGNRVDSSVRLVTLNTVLSGHVHPFTRKLLNEYSTNHTEVGA